MPEKVLCPVHGVDVTEQVIEELAADPEQVPNGFLRARRQQAGLRRYLVIVDCPGPEQHLLDVDGSWEL